MNRTCTGAVAVLAAAGLAVGTATAADAATPASAHGLNASDVSFMKSNEQVNLAEITLAKIVLKHSHTKHARELARVTLHDHSKAQAALQAVAKADGVTLPTAPNAAQKNVAAQLNTAERPNYVYFTAQVDGHEQSIAATRYELTHGSKANVLRYAKYYLPIAQKHLAMSKSDLARWHRDHH